MKKIIFTGIILVLVMAFAVTCDTPEDVAVEYTDVVYSPDGSQITLYLDGVGVPVTPAQRAVNKDLAQMAFDYFEVVFQATEGAVTGSVARASWELGQLAGIYNVPRGTSGAGINYAFAEKTASMFVGKKADKTLLGIGYLINASPSPAAVTAANVFVDDKTLKVTFEIAAIQTCLRVPGDATAETPYPGLLTSNSFTFTGGTAGGAGWALSATTGVRSSVNGSPLQYPRYSLPATAGTVTASYTFSYVNTSPGNNVFDYAKMYYNTTTKEVPTVLKRVPRFMNGGRYMEPKEGWTTTTSVAITPAYNTTPAISTTFATAFSSKNTVLLTFTTNGGTGVFSFYIEIPVLNLTNIAGGFQMTPAVAAEKWYIRTGVGSELYSLDDGVANGGCVFMSVGASAANWLDIDWVWL